MTSSIDTSLKLLTPKASSTKQLIARFPLEGYKPRPSQERYIEAVYNALEDGFRVVVLEAPVGSGKSASAMTWALGYGSSHTLTPRKALQDQYYADFNSFTHLMKGKSAYPCTHHQGTTSSEILSIIASGDTPDPEVYSNGISVQDGWCGKSSSRFSKCTAMLTCPYVFAAQQAELNPHIIHNIMGFLFQSAAGKFSTRKLLVVDEAHDLEHHLREYFSIEFFIRIPPDQEVPDFDTVDEIIEYFSQKRFLPADPDDLEEHVSKLTQLSKFSDMENVFICDAKRHPSGTEVKLIPRNFSGLVENALWRFGEKIVCMSGTIYDKKDFCRRLGLKESETAFIRVESSFPIKYRPIIMKDKYMVNTSHAYWEDNFDDIINSLCSIMDKIPNDKGLIHTPSYTSTEQILMALRAKGYRRAISHTSATTKSTLDAFYKSTEPLVLLSPSCQQGVDFKGDRARFQVIIRVPYLNAADKFINAMLKEDFQWYNLQTLRIFGQQLGRVNRSETDYGVTILMDARFPKFIYSNKRYLPADVLAAIQR